MDVKHYEWFIMGLLSHIIVMLMQYKDGTHADSLKIAMKLEVTPGGEASPGMEYV